MRRFIEAFMRLRPVSTYTTLKTLRGDLEALLARGKEDVQQDEV
jgi:hypothetical protein